MASVAVATLFLWVTLSFVHADIYMHNMRGSNNRLSEANNNRNNANRLFNSQNNNRGGYNQGFMYYYAGSVVPIEWTMQHACGSNNNSDCDVVIQWMCEDTADRDIRDGQTTLTPPDPETFTDYTVGRHETFAYYRACKTRQRNKGLFTSDRNLQGDAAIYTRQNPNGERHGYECPEERDYYPYWHPSPWKDIAVLTYNTSRCAYYRSQSENVLSRWYCSDMRYNTFRTCNASGSVWLKAANFSLPPPDCVQAMWSRDNHLGNVYGGFPITYNWTIPVGAAFDKCVLRLRYNISTGDYDGWDSNVNSSLNGRNKLKTRTGYFLNNAPQVDIGLDQTFELAVNTAQYGRTFQDRSHVFSVRQRPANIPAGAMIWNLNVRGKRGNIVQVFPAVEYDFVPNQLIVNSTDFVHIQWTGSNSNDPNNDGQGTRGTDRSNIVQINSMSLNYPAKIANVSLWPNQTVDRFTTIKTIATLNQNDGELNDAAPYFDAGVHQFSQIGAYYYMCTRNNNFSNRSQKASLVVQQAQPAPVSKAVIVGATVAGASVAAAGAAGIWAFKSGKLAALIGSLKGAAATPTAV